MELNGSVIPGFPSTETSARRDKQKVGAPIVRQCGRVKVEEVDWIATSNERRKRLDQQRNRLSSGASFAAVRTVHESQGHKYDLILAVDCIYNENLVKPLVDTIAEYAGQNTVIWVVVELRSADVVSLLLLCIWAYGLF